MGQLDKLKDYVFSDERRSLGHLERRVGDLPERAKDVAEVLPQSIEINAQDEDKKARLITAISEPVNDSVRESMRQHPQRYADALYPVLGPAIRKAVNEGMRVLAERLNRTVEHSFTRRGLAWRWESFRTGTPMADIILRDTLVYRVEQIFVIERTSGRLCAHVQNDDLQASQDSDAVSAMLTAIQDFVRDSFGAYEQSDLNTVQVGGRTVWILYGPKLMLAVVFFGNPDASLRAEFHSTNELIHHHYAPDLLSASEDAEDIASQRTRELLTPLLTSYAHGGARKDGVALARIAKPVGLIGLLLIGLFAWRSYDALVYDARVEKLVAELENAGGLVVVAVDRASKPNHIKLLKDPGVELPSDLLDQVELSPGEVKFSVYPVHSAEPKFLIERLRDGFKIPATIKLNIEDRRLIASGTAPPTWLTHFLTLPFQWLGIDEVDVSTLQVTDNP